MTGSLSRGLTSAIAPGAPQRPAWCGSSRPRRELDATHRAVCRLSAARMLTALSPAPVASRLLSRSVRGGVRRRASGGLAGQAGGSKRSLAAPGTVAFRHRSAHRGGAARWLAPAQGAQRRPKPPLCDMGFVIPPGPPAPGTARSSDGTSRRSQAPKRLRPLSTSTGKTGGHPLVGVVCPFAAGIARASTPGVRQSSRT